MTTEPLQVGVFGEYSNGKSSLINSIVGKIICSTSIQRETSGIYKYSIRKNNSDENSDLITCTLKEEHEVNKKVRSNNNSLSVSLDDLKKVKIYPTSFSIIGLNMDCDIYDLPGLNDANDTDNKFIKLVEHCISWFDLVIYVTDAKKPLTSASEINHLKTIINLMQTQITLGKFMRLYVVINKFDTPENTDYNEMASKMQDQINGMLPKDLICDSFRFSAHKYLIETIHRQKKSIQVPTFYIEELKSILINSTVVATPALRDKLEQKNILDGSLITYNTYDDWGKKSSNNCGNMSGDWDSLVETMDILSKTIVENRSMSIMKYFVSLLANQIQSLVTWDTFQKIIEKQCILYHHSIPALIQQIMDRIKQTDGKLLPYFFRRFALVSYGLPSGIRQRVYDSIKFIDLLSAGDKDYYIFCGLFYDMLQFGYPMSELELANCIQKITQLECYICTSSYYTLNTCTRISDESLLLSNWKGIVTKGSIKVTQVNSVSTNASFLDLIIHNEMIYNTYPEVWRFFLLAGLQKYQLYYLHKNNKLNLPKINLFAGWNLSEAIKEFINCPSIQPEGKLDHAILSENYFKSMFPKCYPNFKGDPSLDQYFG